ncbi:MAG: hypothetical protein R2788_18585 [Saprospiraceae bacterium]
MVVLKHYFLVAGALPFLPYGVSGQAYPKKILKLLPLLILKGRLTKEANQLLH